MSKIYLKSSFSILSEHNQRKVYTNVESSSALVRSISSSFNWFEVVVWCRDELIVSNFPFTVEWLFVFIVKKYASRVKRIKIRPKPRITNETMAGIRDMFNKIKKDITKKDKS